MPRTRVVAVERDLARVCGDIGGLKAQEARATERLKRLEIRAPIRGSDFQPRTAYNWRCHLSWQGANANCAHRQRFGSRSRAFPEGYRSGPSESANGHPASRVLTSAPPPASGNRVGRISGSSARRGAKCTVLHRQNSLQMRASSIAWIAVQLIPGMPADVMIQTEARLGPQLPC